MLARPTARFEPKHEALNKCWFNVGPTSQTVAQHQINIRIAFFCLLRLRSVRFAQKAIVSNTDCVPMSTCLTHLNLIAEIDTSHHALSWNLTFSLYSFIQLLVTSCFMRNIIITYDNGTEKICEHFFFKERSKHLVISNVRSEPNTSCTGEAEMSHVTYSHIRHSSRSEYCARRQ